MSVDYDALAQAHMAQQVREAATIQAALARLWENTMDPRDMRGSLARFSEAAAVYIDAGRTISARTAQTYIDTLVGLDGLPEYVAPSVAPLDRERLHTSLAASTAKTLGRAAALQRRGHDPSVALRSAMGIALGASKRHVLNASRDRLILASGARGFNGWARVSDGSPCAFCAMLVSRGPVYAKGSGAFGAHDRCGCSVKPVSAKDRTGGWSPQARSLRDLWDSLSDDPSAWRRTIETASTPLALAA